MAKIASVEQMRAIERAADAAGHTYAMMMEQAGWAVAQAVLERTADIAGKHVLVLTGTGNNGGDGLVAADHLAEAGAHIVAYLAKEREPDDPHLEKLRRRGALIAVADQDQRWRLLKLQLGRADIVIDAVLGTGFQLPLRGAAAELLRTAARTLSARETRPFIVAVDCPSGLDCDTGLAASESLAADLTVTLAAAKPGLLTFPGADLVGELVVGDIGLSASQVELAGISVEMADAHTLKGWLPEQPRDAHKGTFGQALILAGSMQYPGAAALAAKSAYRVGAGLVTLAVPEPVQAMIAASTLETTWIPLPHQQGRFAEGSLDALKTDLPNCQALLIGPGFGLAESTGEFLGALLNWQAAAAAGDTPGLPATAFDADSLKLLKQIDSWWERLPPNSVLTPHPGEMSVLSGEAKETIQADRVGTARRYAERWGHVLVLKGAFTVVAAPDGAATVIPVATRALASAGTGDVLAGAIVGLMAQGIPSHRASILAAYLHAQAGLLAARRLAVEAPVVASDVAAALAEALADLLRYSRGWRDRRT